MLEKGWTRVMETPNDFQFTPVDLPYMNTPFYEQHHWLHPGLVQHYVKQPWNPVKRAFRTATLVRGKHPYALIVDDIEDAYAGISGKFGLLKLGATYHDFQAEDGEKGEANVYQHAEKRFQALKHLGRFTNGQVEYLGDVQPLEMYLEGLPIVPAAMTDVTGHIDVG